MFNFLGALLYFIKVLLFEKTYLIVIKDETGLKSKLNDWVVRSKIGSVISKKRGDNSILAKKGILKYEFRNDFLQFQNINFS